LLMLRRRRRRQRAPAPRLHSATLVHDGPQEPVTLTRSDPVGSPYTFDVFSGAGTEALNGHVAVVARFDPQNAPPSTEQLAGLANALRAAGDLPLLGMKECHLAFDAGALEGAAGEELLARAMRLVLPPGIQQARGHQLFGVGYVRQAGHRQGWHAHGQGGSTPSSGGGAHPGHVRDTVRGRYQLQVGCRIGVGTLMLRRGGIGAPVLWLNLPHNAVWVMTRQGAGEFEVMPPPAHDPLQPRAQRLVHHCVPPLREGIDSDVMVTVMAKVSVYAESPEEALRAATTAIAAQMRAEAGSAAPNAFIDDLASWRRLLTGPQLRPLRILRRAVCPSLQIWRGPGMGARLAPGQSPLVQRPDEEDGDEPLELEEAGGGGLAGAAAADADDDTGDESTEPEEAGAGGLAGSDSVSAAAQPGPEMR
ncbi:hypothetical protein ABPG77_010045, partial [Micractinium sp. CCAP 211/92]